MIKVKRKKSQGDIKKKYMEARIKLYDILGTDNLGKKAIEGIDKAIYNKYKM